MLFFVARWVHAHYSRNHAQAELQATLEQIAELEDWYEECRKPIEEAVNAAGYDTVRELEALHERYSKTCDEIRQLRQALAQQQARCDEEEKQTSHLLDRLRTTFHNLNVELAGEHEVQHAANRAISRYQEYRDAKRRVDETRDVPARIEGERSAAQAELDTLEREEVERSLEVRDIMRRSGFHEESKHTGALSAVRAYRIRTAQIRQKRGRIELLDEQVAETARRLEAEQVDLANQENALRRLLDAAEAQSPEHWHELAQHAKEYKDLWGRRTAMQERLDALLEGEDIEALRTAVHNDGPAADVSDRSPEAIKEELQELTDAIDSAAKDEYALKIEITERTAGARPLNEIEEERAEAARRVGQLELEMEAATYAAAIIEEVARNKHARIAPGLASLASHYLSEITGGAYREVLISRDLRISVRVPQTDRLDQYPERSLSMGTVDQIYLALRLALVNSLGEAGESIPMLLDDPFANYDDARLTRALRLLMRLAETSQILLFTCRQDVTRAAQTIGAPVLYL
jgi:DNA repair exonuclease SbcCD ATPase subunit